MAGIEKRAFSLPAEQAAFIDAQVKAGSFASASEVVRAGLRALQERDAAVERWLREDVAATYDRWKAEPAGGLSPEGMAEHMRRCHAGSLKTASETPTDHPESGAAAPTERGNGAAPCGEAAEARRPQTVSD